MADRHTMLARQALGDDRSVTSPGIPLDAEQGAGAFGRQLGDDLLERRAVEDLARVTDSVLLRQLDARSLADASTRVLRILEMTELGRRRQLPVVTVGHPSAGQCGL